MKYTEFFDLAKKGTLSGAYLLHGEEEFVKNAAVHAAEALIPDELRAFNLNVLYDCDLAKLEETCETLPVFSEKTLVIAREPAASIDAAKLGDYLQAMSPTTVLLVVKKGKLDERTAFVKLFSKEGRDVLFGKVDERDAIKWAMKRAVEQGVNFPQDAARVFVGVVGTDMATLNNELQKAIDLVGPGGSITQEVVSRSAIGNIEFKVFGMLDAFTAGKPADGMRSLRALLEEDRDAPFKVVGFLESRFKLMLSGRLLMEKGLSPKAAAQRLEGNSYANEMACRAAAKYSPQSLKKLVSEVSLVMYNSISGGEDAKTALETIMLGFDWKGGGH